MAAPGKEKAEAVREENAVVNRIQDKARRLGMGLAGLRDYSETTEAGLDRRLRARRNHEKAEPTE